MVSSATCGTLRHLMLLMLIPLAAGKVARGSVALGQFNSDAKDEYSWKYLSKFGYVIGAGEYKVRIQAVRPFHNPANVSIPLEVYLDEDWDEVEAMPECTRSERSRALRELTLPADGEWSTWVGGTLRQSVRPHVWYFAIQDCANRLPSLVRVRYEFEARQEDGSEFSVELMGTMGVFAGIVLIYTVFLFFFVKKVLHVRKSSDNIHPVVIVLFIAILMQYICYLFHFFHIWAYQSNGYGIKVLDVLSEITSVVAQILITSLSIFLALGYTITTAELGDLDIVVPIFFIVCIIHILVVGFAKIRDDASFKFHENEGAFGWVLIVFRCGLFLWFWLAFKQTYPNPPMKLRPFLTKFKFASTIYYLSYPVIFIVAGFWAPYLRHKFMTVGLFIMTFLSILAYTRMFLNRGDYFAISAMSASFLPRGITRAHDKDY